MAMIHNLPSSTDSCSVPLTASQTTAAPLAGTLLTGGVLQLGRYSIPAAIPKPIPMKRPVHHSRGRTPVPASAPMFRKCVRVTNTESTGRRSNPPSFQNHACKRTFYSLMKKQSCIKVLEQEHLSDLKFSQNRRE